MRKAYIVEHWILTLLLAPLTAQAIYWISQPPTGAKSVIFELYFLSLVFSIFFSIPTYFLYILSFYFLSKYKVDFKIAKIVLIGVAVTGICITNLKMDGQLLEEIMVSYSITAILVGLLLKLKQKRVIDPTTAETSISSTPLPPGSK